jgi:hypothetical protein
VDQVDQVDQVSLQFQIVTHAKYELDRAWAHLERHPMPRIGCHSPHHISAQTPLPIGVHDIKPQKAGIPQQRLRQLGADRILPPHPPAGGAFGESGSKPPQARDAAPMYGPMF